MRQTALGSSKLRNCVLNKKKRVNFVRFGEIKDSEHGHMATL